MTDRNSYDERQNDMGQSPQTRGEKDGNSVREKLNEITANLEKEIENLFESDKYRKYLKTMSRFPRYSLRNVLLINMQRPNATYIAGFDRWKKQFGRHVMKGEQGITIIAPAPYKKTVTENVTDPVTKQPIVDENGQVRTRSREITVPVFRTVKVFDISQTQGRPLPQLAENLTGNVKDYGNFMEAVKRSSPVPVEFSKIQEGTDGFFTSKERKIYIREGMSEVQTISATLHEIAHAKLHDPEKKERAEKWKIIAALDDGRVIDIAVGFPSNMSALDMLRRQESKYRAERNDVVSYDVTRDFQREEGIPGRNTREVQAESVAYAVCAYYGIDTGDNSFGYIAEWSKGKELEELKTSLETINRASCDLIKDIDGNYAEIVRENELEKRYEKDTEGMFEISGSEYLHMQRDDNMSWDYSIYDSHTFELKDGGILDSPELSLIQAKYEILKCFGRSPEVTVPITGEEYHEILGKINEAGLEFIHKARQGLLYSEGLRSDSDGHEKNAVEIPECNEKSSESESRNKESAEISVKERLREPLDDSARTEKKMNMEMEI